MAKFDGTANWSVSLKRYERKWCNDFTEHWTLQSRDGKITFKQRVVGPNGEVCRREGITVEEVDHEIRDVFDGMLEVGQEKL